MALSVKQARSKRSNDKKSMIAQSLTIWLFFYRVKHALTTALTMAKTTKPIMSRTSFYEP